MNTMIAKNKKIVCPHCGEETVWQAKNLFIEGKSGFEKSKFSITTCEHCKKDALCNDEDKNIFPDSDCIDKVVAFISHESQRDKKIIEQARRILDTAFIEPLIIVRKEKPGISLKRQIAAGIETSQVVVPIITKNSQQIQWLNQEIGYAYAMQKPIYPIVQKEHLRQMAISE